MGGAGIFFHYQEGERLRDIHQALEGLLEQILAVSDNGILP
jgi:hypothetical protein